MLNRFIVSLPVLAMGVVAGAMTGCAGWNSTRQAIARNTANDVGPPRESRKDAVARDFDLKRDDVQFDAAASCWQRGDAKGAGQMLSKLLERNPSHRRARLLLADIYLFDGDLDQAADELTKAVKADPKDAIAQHALAQVLDASGRHQEALGHYEQATKLDPTNEVYAVSFEMVQGIIPPTDRATALSVAKNQLSQAATNGSAIGQASTADGLTGYAKNRDNAVERAVDIRPAARPAQSAQLNLASGGQNAAAEPLANAVAALAEGDAAAAIELASRGLAQSPEETPQLYRVLGAAYYRMGEYQKAQAALAQALSLDKSDALTYFLMGSTLDKLNDHARAAQHFSQAARLDSRFGG